MTPTSWYSHPCAVPSHTVSGWAYVARIWQKQRCVTSEIRLLKCGFSLSSIIVSGGSQLLWLEDTQAAFGEARAARNWGHWPTASEELSPANNHMSDLGSRPSILSPALRWLQPQPMTCLQPQERPWANTPEFLTLKDSEIINIYCSQLLSFRVIVMHQ